MSIPQMTCSHELVKKRKKVQLLPVSVFTSADLKKEKKERSSLRMLKKKNAAIVLISICKYLTYHEQL